MYFTGIIIAVCTFLTIGIWHPIVIKTEYYWGTRPWWIYLVIGLTCIIAALFIENAIVSAVVGVLQFLYGDYFKRHIMINTLDIIVDAGDEMLVDGLTNL